MSTAAAAAAPQQPPQAPVADRGFSTLYIGDLDKRVTEPQIVELFSRFGPILSCRVIRDIVTRASLGYGYVNFQNQADAEKALKELNFADINGRQIRLMWQQRDPSQRYSGAGNLFVKNLPAAINHKTLHELFKPFGAIQSCKVITDPDTGKSRNYGFVHFTDAAEATKALTALNGKTVDSVKAEEDEELKGLYVANFIKRNARIAALVANFTNVYIKQVLPDVTKADVEKFFSKFGGIASAVTKTDKRGRVFAFCDFKAHEDAVKAIEAVNEKTVKGMTAEDNGMYVARAQTRSERLIELRQLYMQRQAMGNNLYVRNFGAEVTGDDLKELFSNFGEITSARVMMDDGGNSRGFGFLSFAAAEAANQALKEMNGRMLHGKPLVVNIAQRRDQRTSMLQVQFQQRLQAMLQRLPMGPIIAGPPSSASRPPASMRSTRGTKTRAQPPTQSPPSKPSTHPHAEVSVRVDASAKTTSPAMQAELGNISAEALMMLDEDSRKEALGERLFVRVHAMNEEAAPKITGMLLEMPTLEAHALLENAQLLREKVVEAEAILKSQE